MYMYQLFCEILQGASCIHRYSWLSVLILKNEELTKLCKPSSHMFLKFHKFPMLHLGLHKQNLFLMLTFSHLRVTGI